MKTKLERGKVVATYKEGEPETRVVFRVWNDDFQDTLALFPDLPEGRGLVLSYQHIGQHGAADYQHCISKTRPAKPEEYANLARELEGIGYRLKIVKRR